VAETYWFFDHCFLGILGDAKGFSSAVSAWFEAMCILYDRSG
jgi:hypothetical protein